MYPAFGCDYNHVSARYSLPTVLELAVAKKILLVTLHLLLGSILAGCADMPAPPAEQMREEWGNLVVAPARFAPQSNIRSFAVGKGEGAAKGAAVGSAAGAVSTLALATTGAMEAIVAPYLAVIMVPTMAASGAIAGSQAAITEQDAAAMETHIQQNLANLEVPGTLAQAIITTAKQDTGQQLPILPEVGPNTPEAKSDYRALAQQGADTVLEVITTEVGFHGGKQLRFYLVATIHVVRVKDGKHLYQREFVYQSDDYEAPRWAENQAALLQAELQRSYANLAESVVENVFLLTGLPLESRATASGATYFFGAWDACGLAWVSPQREYHPKMSDTEHSNWNRFPTVANRQPTLAWEAMPRDSDRRTVSKAVLSAISNVRYDLRVWQVINNAPPRLIYERRDLPTPFHTLEQPLSPKSRYFWSARARFELAGRVHATKWGYYRTPYFATYGDDKVKSTSSPGAIVGVFTAGMAPRDPCTLDFIPTSNYYRFQTP
jgi:hypothetical protein